MTAVRAGHSPNFLFFGDEIEGNAGPGVTGPNDLDMVHLLFQEVFKAVALVFTQFAVALKPLTESIRVNTQHFRQTRMRYPLSFREIFKLFDQVGLCHLFTPQAPFVLPRKRYDG